MALRCLLPLQDQDTVLEQDQEHRGVGGAGRGLPSPTHQSGSCRQGEEKALVEKKEIILIQAIFYFNQYQST